MVKIGVVILNYQTWHETVMLVDKLLAFRSPKFELFIEIVDNCSPNESYECLSERYGAIANVEVFRSDENGGFARGNNCGLRRLSRVSPDYALVVNNDVLFDAEALERCMDMYPKLERAGVVSPVQFWPNGERAPFRRLRCNTFFDDVMSQFRVLHRIFRCRHKYVSNTQFANAQSVDIIPGCFMFIDYELFRQLEFFYEGTFLYCEERFLYKKTSAANLVNYILLDCSYTHNHSATISSEVSLRRQRRLLHEGRILFTEQYRSHPKMKTSILKIAYRLNMMESLLIDRLTPPYLKIMS